MNSVAEICFNTVQPFSAVSRPGATIRANPKKVCSVWSAWPRLAFWQQPATGFGVLCEGLRYDCVCIVNVVFRYQGCLAILVVELVYAGQKSPVPVLSEELEIQFFLLCKSNF